MKKLIIFLFLFLSTSSFSQLEYPRIEKDSLGNEIVLLTLEQAQKLDNTAELMQLLEKAGTDCDAVVTSQIKVIDELNHQISLQEAANSKLREQLRDSQNKTQNALLRLGNCETDRNLCEEQKANYEEQKKILTKEIRRSKLRMIGGYVVGGVGVILGTVLGIVIK